MTIPRRLEAILLRYAGVILLILPGSAFASRSYTEAHTTPMDWLSKGMEASYKNDSEGAITYLTEAIKRDPNFTIAYFNRGSVYSTKGDSDKAIEDYNRVIADYPKFAMAYSYRGLSYEAKGDVDKALKDEGTAIQLNPYKTMSYYLRGLTYFRKHAYDEAIADFTQAIHPDPKPGVSSAEDRDRMENESSRMGDSSFAVLDLEGEHPYYLRGVAYTAKGDEEKAMADFDKSIETEPKFGPAYAARGDLYDKKGEHEKALADYKQAVQIDPNSALIHNALAWLMATSPQAGLRNGSVAVQEATKACDLSGWKDPAIIDTLAAAYAEIGGFDQAVKWEETYLAVPHLSPSDVAEGQSRLKLYKAHKPYHSE